MTVAAYIVSSTGDTSNLTHEQRVTMSPSEAAARQKGTKWFIVGWYTYIGLIWGLKINMLFLFKRLVSMTWVSAFIKPLMVFVGASGVAIWVILSTACRPFNHMWQIYPDPGRKYVLEQKRTTKRY